jgi:hypothetical protein
MVFGIVVVTSASAGMSASSAASISTMSAAIRSAIEAVATAHLIQQARADLFAEFRLLGHVPLLLQHRDHAVKLSHLARDAGEDSAACVVHKASLSVFSERASQLEWRRRAHRIGHRDGESARRNATTCSQVGSARSSVPWRTNVAI